MSDQRLVKAITTLNQKRYSDCRAVCAAILREKPADYEAVFLDGVAAFCLGDAAKLRSAALHAEQINPTLRSYDMFAGVMRYRDNASDEKILVRRLSDYFRIRNTDAFFISFPKCGRTWVRFMMGKYFEHFGYFGDPLDTLSATRRLKNFTSLDFSHDDYPHLKPVDMIETDKRAYKDKRILFMVRDPRDVLVSNYFQQKTRGRRLVKEPFDGPIGDFIFHEVGGLPSIVRFFNIWANSRDKVQAFHLLSYEELATAPETTMSEIVNFLNWPKLPKKKLAAVIASGDFSKMRKLEETNALKNVRLAPPKDGNPDGFKVRRGKIGGYRDYFDEVQIAKIGSYVDEHLDPSFARYRSCSS